ncbi:hypothetical protein [Streptomyces nojiriensis]|uniref:hypothetical protein n=1 Tax=Streptomyces nojiriensis TaxID=66374 RepID=UPI0036698B4E
MRWFGRRPAGHRERGRGELPEPLLDAVRDGALSTAQAQAPAWHHISGDIPDADAASRAGTTAGAWQRRRSRAPARLTAFRQSTAAASGVGNGA